MSKWINKLIGKLQLTKRKMKFLSQRTTIKFKINNSPVKMKRHSCNSTSHAKNHTPIHFNLHGNWSLWPAYNCLKINWISFSCRALTFSGQIL